MLLRREVLGKAAVGAAAAVTLGAARTGAAATQAGTALTSAPHGPQAGQAVPTAAAAPAVIAAEAPSAPAPWALLSPLTAGATLAAGWQLVDLSPVRDGVCVATLGTASGRTQRVHLCRNAGEPQGLVYTRGVDLVVMNGGQRELPTEESLAQAVAALAHTVAANEPQVTALLGTLQTHTERVERFATAQGPEADGKLR